MPRGRSPYLPPQEDVTNTYMDPEHIPAGRFSVRRITRDSLESAVREAWSAIMADVFSYHDGYSISHEAPVGTQRIDMKVSRVENRSCMSFLVLELKRSSCFNSPEALRGAKRQLVRYLQSLRNIGSRKRWGALCIGKNVQFYKVKMSDGRVELDTLHDGMLRIDRQPGTVTQYLEYIKSQAA